MGEKLLLNKAAKIAVEDIVQKVMDIFEAEDGRVFEEKKKEVIEYLKNQEDTLLAERVLSAAINDEKGRCWKEKFWQAGETLQSNGHVILRKVKETDREMFLELQRETSMMRSMLKEEGYRLMLWDEHIQDKALMATIEVDDEYAGYCGINNLSSISCIAMISVFAFFALLTLLFSILRKAIPVIIFDLLTFVVFRIIQWDFEDRGVISNSKYDGGIALYIGYIGVVIVMAGAVTLLVMKIKNKKQRKVLEQ